MSATDKVAWNVAPPVSGSGTSGADGVFRIATSGANAAYEIPKGWKGRFVDFRAIGQDMEIAFGGSGIVLVYGQVSTAPAGVPTMSAASGFPIPAGQKDGFYVPNSKDITHFAVIAAGAGSLAAYPSTNRRPDGTNTRI